METDFTWISQEQEKEKTLFATLERTDKKVILSVYNGIREHLELKKGDYIDIGFNIEKRQIAIRKINNDKGTKVSSVSAKNIYFTFPLSRYPFSKHQQISFYHSDVALEKDMVIIDAYDKKLKAQL